MLNGIFDLPKLLGLYLENADPELDIFLCQRNQDRGLQDFYSY